MKNLPRSFRFVVLSLLSILATGLRAAVYVSPAGDDANPGTQGRPIRTLEHARDLVRGMNAKLTGDIVIYLAGGTYRLTEPLVLDGRDSGGNGYNVIFSAVPGQIPVISGGLQVGGWKQVDAARNLWAAPAPAGLQNTRQLYVDGVRAQRARGRLPVALKMTAAGYEADSALLAGWRNPGDIEFVYTGGNTVWSEREEGLGSWTEPRCPVASIQGTTIVMAQPCWDNSTKRVMLPRNSGFKRAANLVGPASVGKQPAYMENAFELLGTPGQWYLDRPARTIYYVPRTGEDLAKADVEVPVLEQLIVGNGSEEQPLQHLVFTGIEFAYATWLFPSTGEGFSEIQANYMVTGPKGYAVQGLGPLAPGGTEPFGAWTEASGNVAFRQSRQVQFQRDAFVHLGGAGLALGEGSQDDAVVGCIFTDISSNGLELGGVDLPEAPAGKLTRDNRILNNHFTDIGAEYHGGIAIVVGYTQRTLIQHNQLDHLPYAGISIGWGGWMDKVKRPGVANNSRDNVIAQNLIFDHMLLLSDGGGIYTQGLTGPTLAEGEKVTGNVIHDQFGTGHGIYSDNGSCNMTVANNVMFHTNHDNWGSRHGDYYDGNNGRTHDPIDVLGNYWQQGDPDVAEGNVTEAHNRIISALDQAPAATLANAGLEEAFKGILDLRFAAPSAPASPSRVAAVAGDGFALVAWSPPAFEGGSPVESYAVASSRGERATISAPDFRTNGYVRVPGLANGAECTFTVTAVNRQGASAPSLPSFPVKPEAKASALPSAPQHVAVHASGGMASIHFQAPAKDGGSPVTAYEFTVNPGGRKVAFTGRPVLTLAGAHVTFGVVDGLKGGETYTFAVAAVNAVGAGPETVSGPVTVAP